jgi:PBP1b-binding outer membrane lipoprotein LpoB
MTAKARLITIATVGVLAILLAGCTSDAAPKPTPTPTASETAPEPGITDITDTPGSGEGLVGALADSAVETCERSGDAWKVAGTVTNSSDAAATYRIYVSLLNAATDTRALTQVDVAEVAPGATEDWSTDVAVAEDDLSCVLRVERYAA